MVLLNAPNLHTRVMEGALPNASVAPCPAEILRLNSCVFCSWRIHRDVVM